MAPEAVPVPATAAALTAATSTRGYAPSWLHELIDLVERLPGPTWLAYVGLALLLMLAIHALEWANGTVATGTIDPSAVYYGALPIALIWIAGYLEQVAAVAFDAFRPALALGDAELRSLRYELTVRPALLSQLF